MHFGSLLSALASYLHAHQNKGQWLVRMEDLDPPREQAGAADDILKSLLEHGLEWHGPVLYQSSRLNDYRDLLSDLVARKQVYRCNCSRQQVQANGGIYNNRCRTRTITESPFALRLQVDADTGISPQVSFEDIYQGPQHQDVTACVGDFILQRKDHFYAYQLAVVADDIEQNISHIIRGSDLLCSTARQIYFFQQLQAAPPRFGHIPVATHSDGQKLSKQNHAPALADTAACDNLFQALQFLQLLPPEFLRGAPVQEQLNWAIKHANLTLIPRQMGIAL